MKIAGIILIVLQCLGTAAALIAGSNPFAGGFGEILGYFLFGLIGVILVIAAKKKKVTKKAQQNPDAAKANLTEMQNPAIDVNSAKAEEVTDGYTMNEALKAKYTRMFRQPFSQVINEDAFVINNRKCVMYTFSPQYVLNSDIGTVFRMIAVEEETPRYFASELSFNNTFVLCEWLFHGETKTGHVNYGEVVSSRSDLLHHTENIKKLLTEILTN